MTLKERKVRFKSNYTSLPDASVFFKKGSIIDAYIYLKNHRRTILYIPAQKRIALATEYKIMEGIWRADTGYGAFDFSLTEDGINDVERTIGLRS